MRITDKILERSGAKDDYWQLTFAIAGWFGSHWKWFWKSGNL